MRKMTERRAREIISHKARTIGFVWNNFSPNVINRTAWRMLREGKLEVVGGQRGRLHLMCKLPDTGVQ